MPITFGNELENEFDSNHLFDDFWKNNPRRLLSLQSKPGSLDVGNRCHGRQFLWRWI